MSATTDFWLGLDVLKALTHSRHYSAVRVELQDSDGKLLAAEWSGQRAFRVGNQKAYFDSYSLSRSSNFNSSFPELEYVLPQGSFKTSDNLKALLAQIAEENGITLGCEENVLSGGWWYSIKASAQLQEKSCPIKSNLNAKVPFCEGIPNIKATWVKFRT